MAVGFKPFCGEPSRWFFCARSAAMALAASGDSGVCRFPPAVKCKTGLSSMLSDCSSIAGAAAGVGVAEALDIGSGCSPGGSSPASTEVRAAY